MATIGIMGALDEEVALYLSKLEERYEERLAGFVFHSGTLRGEHVVVVKSGVGKVNAGVCAQALIDCFSITHLIFTGVAGAINPQLGIKEIVVSKQSIQHDMDARKLGYSRGQIPFSNLKAFDADASMVEQAMLSSKKAGINAIAGIILSGDQFIADPKLGQELRSELGGDCVDMESAAVAHACSLNKIPHVIIRSISDKADHSAQESFEKICHAAANNSFAIVYGMLPHIALREDVPAIINSKIRTIPDWPKKGVMFRDITTLLKDPEGLSITLDYLAKRHKSKKIDLIAGIESRGFIVGAALADRLGVGFVPIRKKGKLPGKTISASYSLEYGTDTLELHEDAIQKGARVLIFDDLIATGGTATAACELVSKLGGEVVECCFIVDLPDLGGSKKLKAAGQKVFAITHFEGD